MAEMKKGTERRDRSCEAGIIGKSLELAGPCCVLRAVYGLVSDVVSIKYVFVESE